MGDRRVSGESQMERHDEQPARNGSRRRHRHVLPEGALKLAGSLEAVNRPSVSSRPFFGVSRATMKGLRSGGCCRSQKSRLSQVGGERPRRGSGCHGFRGHHEDEPTRHESEAEDDETVRENPRCTVAAPRQFSNTRTRWYLPETVGVPDSRPSRKKSIPGGTSPVTLQDPLHPLWLLQFDSNVTEYA